MQTRARDTAETADTDDTDDTAGRWLAAFAVAVVVGHHLGTLLGGLGELGGRTEWADWADLLVPYAVVGTAFGTLRAARAGRRAWGVAGLGAMAYVQGHGIHLAANSIGNARGDEAPVHLWDEVVGHYVWYGGLYVLLAVLASALLRRRFASAWRWPLAVLVGLTLADNGIEGGTPLLTLPVVVALAVWALRRRSGSGTVLLVAAGTTAVALAGWGLYWTGFPQFSELGWI